ncbi:preprotein translocase subunit SecE [Gluconobacter sp. Dm-74]|nr:preprotein translocase subunit SecE [Gluconobacter albidus]MBS1060377.1 preprotein translocase subunit SecE [Gluconobacter sp. Dm-44]MBS1092092.1 preprotein translocase subunit SecE [Gluconobacter sp. Dm-74]
MSPPTPGAGLSLDSRTMVSVSTPKDESRKTAPQKNGSGFNLVAYVRDVRAEAKRVTWPTRRNTLITSGAVLVMVTVTCIFFFIVDQLIGLGVRGLFGVGG